MPRSSRRVTDEQTAPHREKRSTETLVLSHIAVATSVARRYSHGPQERDDMQQVAYIGLIKAARRFDPDRGHEFIDYAVPTIAGECKRYLRDNGWMVRPPRAVQELRHRIVTEQPRLTQKLHRDPNAHEFAREFDTSTGLIKQATASHTSLRPASLDEVDPLGDRSPTLAAAAGDSTDDIDEADAMRRACATLSERDRRILFMRYVDDRTQAEIGEELGISQMQVSRILRRIFAALREQLEEDPAISL